MAERCVNREASHRPRMDLEDTTEEAKGDSIDTECSSGMTMALLAARQRNSSTFSITRNRQPARLKSSEECLIVRYGWQGVR